MGKTACATIEALHLKIAEGIYKVGDSLGKEMEMAEAFNVSRTTIRSVNKFLEQQGMVKCTPGKGIFLRKASLEGYKSAAAKEELLLIRSADQPLNNEIFQGVMESPLADKFKISLVDATGEFGDYSDILNHLPENIKHVILFPLEIPQAEQAVVDAVKRGVNVIQLDRMVEGLQTPAITFDNLSGASLATRHLLKNHDEPVYFLGNHLSPSSVCKRFAGWQAVMAEFGFDDFEKYVIPGFSAREFEFIGKDKFLSALEQFLETRKGKITSIFAVTDFLAALVYKCCKKLDMRVGKDVFLVGFDDLELCRRLSPPLSSIKTPRYELGNEAIAMINGTGQQSYNKYCCKLVPVELVVRESSAVISNNQ